MKKILFLCTLFAFTATILPRASDASPTVKETSYKAKVFENDHSIIANDLVVVDHAAVITMDVLRGEYPLPASSGAVVTPNYNFRGAVHRTCQGNDRYYHTALSRTGRMVKGPLLVQRE